MNYLAHFYLADPDADLMFGNFIGDGVRGSDLRRFSAQIARGVRFHRFIDTFTDGHDDVLNAKKLFYPSQSKYSGVVVDVLFDHLLALKWDEHHEESLEEFARRCYAVIDEKNGFLPIRSERFFRYMIQNQILTQYATRKGIENVFLGMDHRTSFDSNMVKALDESDAFWVELNTCFDRFFPKLIKACTEWKKTH
ncbi:MAG: ACP phosphodiesterase [Cryomorphaceae bacterium]